MRTTAKQKVRVVAVATLVLGARLLVPGPLHLPQVQHPDGP
ncbi:MAG: hypothetical protein JWM19_4735 [Actinomycetia bacterium]|nr:hypothetical protein [Actinomycetes bacterium]